MKWFNYMSTDLPVPIAVYKKEGKHFVVCVKEGRTHRSQFCQVGPNIYRFISPDGNRIVDDNTEIKSAEETRECRTASQK